MENNENKTPFSLKKKIIIIAAIVVGVLLLAAVGVYIWINAVLNNIDRLPDEQPTETTMKMESFGDDVEAEEKDPVVEEAERILSSKNVINILIVGQDRREGEEEERTRSDSMILCTVNLTKKKFTMTSFMRDMWVYIPDYKNTRMNNAYKLGGFELLNKTLEYNFGTSAEHNVEIDFSGFMAAIDAIGGIDIELTAAEAKYLNRRGNWDIETDCNWELTKGMNHLTGSQALAYSRIRQIGDDFARTNRQRKVLSVLIDKAKTLGLTETYRLIRTIIPMVSTDMTNNEIMGLAMAVLPALEDMEIVSQRIPADGQFSYDTKPTGEEVIDLSPKQFEANKKLLVEAMEE